MMFEEWMSPESESRMLDYVTRGGLGVAIAPVATLAQIRADIDLRQMYRSSVQFGQNMENSTALMAPESTKRASQVKNASEKSF